MKTKDEDDKKEDKEDEEKSDSSSPKREKSPSKNKEKSPDKKKDSSPEKSMESSPNKKKEKKSGWFSKKKKVEEEDNSTVNLDSLLVLKDIDLKVKKGEFVCVIGDVGAGKSSLLSSIIGDLIPFKHDQVNEFLEQDNEVENTQMKKEDARKLYQKLLHDVSESKEPVIELNGNIAYV